VFLLRVRTAKTNPCLWEKKENLFKNSKVSRGLKERVEGREKGSYTIKQINGLPVGKYKSSIDEKKYIIRAIPPPFWEKKIF